MDDRLHVQAFCRDARESVLEWKPHLVAENTACSRASPIGLFHALIKNVFDELQVLFHARCFKPGGQFQQGPEPFLS